MKNCKGCSNEMKIPKYIGQILSSWTTVAFVNSTLPLGMRPC